MSRLPLWRPPGFDPKPPAVVRFRGVEPGSPEAHLLGRAFGPQIKQFYLKAAQLHALGNVEQSRRQLQISDVLHVQYTNQFGQEIVDVSVAPYAMEQVLRPQPRLYNAALVEIYLPTYNAWGSTMFRSLAALTSPQVSEIGIGSVAPLPGVGIVNGVNFDSQVNASPAYVKTPPNATDNVVEVPHGEIYASYLFDFTHFGGVPFVSADLYAVLLGNFDLPLYALKVSPYPISRDENGEYPLEERPPPIPSAEEGGTFYDYPDENDGTFFDGQPAPPQPEIEFIGTQQQWVFSATVSNGVGSPGYVDYSGYTREPMDGTINGHHIVAAEAWNRWYVFTGSFDEFFYFSGPIPVPGEVQVSMFPNPLTLPSTRYPQTVRQTYHRWVKPSGDPFTPQMRFDCSVPVIDMDDAGVFTLENLYDAQLIGNVTFDRRMGAASFTPA